MSFSHFSPLNNDFTIPDHTLRQAAAVAWQSPSNIALVKYWGKKNGQYPVNPSLSMTLQRAFTQTRLRVMEGGQEKGLMALNGDPMHPFLPKMRHLLEWMSGEIPVLKQVSLVAETENSFPHSTGIASSASGISALALCLLDLAGTLLGSVTDRGSLIQMASYAARAGSGSACRSLYGGFAVWGASQSIAGSSDEFAIPVTNMIHPEMLTLNDAILVISGKPKSLSSTRGHRSMEDHPFAASRIVQASRNLVEALNALAVNDFEKLCSVAECEALTLHALLMSANPGTLLMQPGTVEVIHRVVEARKNGIPVFFTLDAGANVHVMYQDVSASGVEKFIADALQPLCENGRVIFDRCGPGPIRLNDNSYGG